jgi:hypothetical protein
MSIVKIIITALIILVLAFFYFPLKDGFLGVPYDFKEKLTYLGDNSFSLEIDIPCNRIFTREIGLFIEPPVYVKSVLDAQSSITGNVSLIIKQGKETIAEKVDLSQTGYSISSKGVWAKPIARYKPIGSFFCNNQSVLVEIDGLKFTLDDHNDHDISLYVSRDRRP